MSTNILKVSAPFISSPLNYICNKSTISETFPTHLKYSIVKPLYKKGDKKNKVFEKIIYERLVQHTEINNILVEEQFGFRPSTSTDKASYKLIKEILNELNNGIMVGGIFCDLQKAFVLITTFY
jgi:hypothetical protein